MTYDDDVNRLIERGERAAMAEYDAKPVLPYAGTSGWSGSDASRERAEERDKSGKTATVQQMILDRIIRVGAEGQTIKDLRDSYRIHHGTLSGALTALHKGGKILRLTDKRDRCSIYVAPQFLLGREAVSPKYRLTRDPEIDEAAQRIRDFLVARKNMPGMADRQRISSAFVANQDAYLHLTVADLEKVLESLR